MTKKVRKTEIKRKGYSVINNYHERVRERQILRNKMKVLSDKKKERSKKEKH